MTWQENIMKAPRHAMTQNALRTWVLLSTNLPNPCAVVYPQNSLSFSIVDPPLSLSVMNMLLSLMIGVLLDWLARLASLLIKKKKISQSSIQWVSHEYKVQIQNYAVRNNPIDIFFYLAIFSHIRLEKSFCQNQDDYALSLGKKLSLMVNCINWSKSSPFSPA